MHTLASARELVGRQPVDLPAPRDADDVRSVCHDLRGHLAAIGMIASALRADPGLPPAVDRRLGSLLAEVDITTEMVRRVVTGHRDVAELALDALAHQCASRAADISGVAVDCLAEHVMVAADRLQLTRLLGNLLDNAVRAAGPRGRVQVRVLRCLDLDAASRPGAVAVLTVEDDGPGFGAGEPGLASLGLEVARAVVAETGGTLELGSSMLGGGRATVTLPAT